MSVMNGNASKSSAVPLSEYIKVRDLTIPLWIRLIVFLIKALTLFAILYRLIRSPLDFLLAVITFVLLSFINTCLHEKCHQIIFEMLTGKPAIIRIRPITSSCRPTATCSIPAYLAAQIFPLITSAGLGVITSVLYIFNAPPWIIIGFTLATISSFLGSSGDLYWAYKLRNFPTDYLVVDLGTWAEVYAPPTQ